ncbi:MAG: glycosyl transferase family 36 [Anaerolineae bacterium]|nr:glycosyl transferase family 36 [Anaerolineae bacterium]
MPETYRIQNVYGYLDEETGEYVITRPDTPTPWMNYIGEGRYGGIVSNTGGGYSFDRDPKHRRVTRYRYNGVPADQPGRYVYLRDMETGDYWSPTWQPVPERTLDRYECRHGPGYTRIRSEYGGIHTEILYFVPPAAFSPFPGEIWVLKVRNGTGRTRRLRAFSYAEFSYWGAEIDLHNLDWGQHILQSRFRDGIIYTATRFRPTTTFFTSNAEPMGFDTDREVFIGRYRDLSNPIVVVTGEPQNSQAPRGNNIGSLSHDLILSPGEEHTLIYLMGVTDEPETIPILVEKYRRPELVQAAFEALRADWRAYLEKFQVETPDPEMNAMLNWWNQIQCRATLFWSRFVSAYETGLGRGMGTRDSAQDSLATAHNAPERVRETLTMLWKLQFQDGHTWHQVFPLTGEGGPGLAAEFPEWPQWFCDDHLWLILATVAYLRETGDFAYLDTRLPYQDGGEDTVWGHILRAVEFTLNHRGPHGLPRLGFADWDDTMNLDHGSGKAESVMAAQQFCRVALDLADLCDALGKTEEAARFRALKEEMARIINEVAWDGAWYARAFDDEGRPVGVQSEPYHQISLNTQTWAVIGECAPRERAEKAMESAHEKLNTPFGLAILWPPYERGDERVRGTTTYPPGAKENGGIFCHTNPWAIIAAVQLGWADRAYQYYRQMMPLARQDNDRYQVEPYVYCGNIAGPTHPQFGYGRNAWLTGTASWMFVAATQWILGIRPTFRGLQVAPAIPPSWSGFRARRVFRGVTYHIQVERQGPGPTLSLEVDGRPIEGTVIPFPPEEQREVKVRVVLK